MSVAAPGAFLDEVPTHPSVPYYQDGTSFLGPNERNQADERELLAGAGEGVHVAVGTERGFIGAALNPNASHLLLLDQVQAVVRFNRINVVLLKLAADRREYLSLRLAPSHLEWEAALERATREGSARLSREERELLTEDGFRFWRRSLADPDFLDFQKKPSGPGAAFGGANYLYEDRLFQRVSAMAKSDGIRAIQVDLMDYPRLGEIAAALAHAHLRVGVLDISNAWWPRYLGSGSIPNARNAFARLLGIFARVGGDSSLLLMSNGNGRDKMNWRYLSAPLVGSEDGARTLYDRLVSIRGRDDVTSLPGVEFAGTRLSCLLSRLGAGP